MNWSAVICRGLVAAEHRKGGAPVNLRKVQEEIFLLEGASISKQFLHRKLAKLVEAGIAKKTTASSYGDEPMRGRGRPTRVAYASTERAINYLAKKGISGGDLVFARRIDVIILEAPGKTNREKFVKEYYKRLGYDVLRLKLVNTRSIAGIPKELEQSLDGPGTPDFLMYKPDFSEYFFVECKAPSTGLSASQLDWIVSKARAPMKLIYVKEKEKADETKLVRVDDVVYKQLHSLVGKLQAQRGKLCSVDDAISYLFERARKKHGRNWMNKVASEIAKIREKQAKQVRTVKKKEEEKETIEGTGKTPERREVV